MKSVDLSSVSRKSSWNNNATVLNCECEREMGERGRGERERQRDRGRAPVRDVCSLSSQTRKSHSVLF